MTRGELIRQLAAALGARHEARIIVEEVLGGGAGDPTSEEMARALALGQRCVDGEPLQYVLGHWSFRSLDLLVDPRVLIPRPETEQVVEVALAELRALGERNPVVVDAGTGSGAIALSLATELAAPGVGGSVYAIDASADALAVARANEARVRGGVDGGAMLPVTFLAGNWLDPLPERLRGAVSLIVSNPPYVAEAEWPGLPVAVRAEPRGALVAADGREGTPGLADVEAVLGQSLTWLARPGRVVIELAPQQAAAAATVARGLGFDEVETAQDLAGRDRMVVGRLG